jgi:hypothetical protein
MSIIRAVASSLRHNFKQFTERLSGRNRGVDDIEPRYIPAFDLSLRTGTSSYGPSQHARWWRRRRVR